MKRKFVNPKSMTDEQARAASAEFQRLFELAQAQLVEHRMWMQLQIDALGDGEWCRIYPGVNRSPNVATLIYQKREQIKLLVMEIELGNIRVEKLADGTPYIGVIYEFPDELVAFLQNEETPAALRNVLAGGTPMDDEALTKVRRLKDGEEPKQ